MQSRGFTLLELSAVLTGIAILTALAVPSYRSFVLRARSAEAQAMVESIAHAEWMTHRARGTFVACAPSSPQVPRGRPGRFDGEADGWATLGISVDGPVWYRYRVEADENAFQVIAEGDLDGDGRWSTFRLDHDDPVLRVEDALE